MGPCDIDQFLTKPQLMCTRYVLLVCEKQSKTEFRCVPTQSLIYPYIFLTPVYSVEQKYIYIHTVESGY